MNVRLIYFLYRVAQIAALPFIVLYFLCRGAKNPRYFRQFGQRLGFLPHHFKQTADGSIWLHAVSVGEVLAAAGLLRKLREAYPHNPLFVSSTTLAGKALAEEKLKTIADGVFYAPIDYCFAVRRVLRTIRPAVVIVAETEIWPNLYREARRAGCALLVVNGRISGRAAPRYRRFRWFFGAVLSWPHRILAQDELSRQRYLDMGAPTAYVAAGGNLKYDFDVGASKAPEAVRRLLDYVRPDSVWIAASTMPPADTGDVDEDDTVIDAFRQTGQERAGLLLILVPRKPERFDTVAAKLEAAGVPFVRRTSLESGSPSLRLPGVLLVDTIGELSGLFSLADVVFMGGTLARRGGHNVLEPAFFGKPVIVGPHMENFPEIAMEFGAEDAWVAIPDAAALARSVRGLLNDETLRLAVGARARTLAEAKRGATAKACAEIERLLSLAIPSFRPVSPLYQLLWILSGVWWLGTEVKQAFDSARRERLRTSVISVGGLSVGGSGKTPFVLWLAERLNSNGLRPAILTRGYRRHGPEKATVLDAGALAAVARTGDEAQIFLRSGVGPVGIGASRAATGREIERQFRPGVFVLDDGFQHWRLARDLDIVLVDALCPFGWGHLLPLGRLREPVAALKRAGAFVITRAESGRPLDGIRAVLQRINPTAPIYQARVSPKGWFEVGSGQSWGPAGLPYRTAAAFCGLANPDSFWHTLRLLGLRPALSWKFGDHHRYKPIEIRRMAAQARSAGVEVLLTTQKDLMNLPDAVRGLIEPITLAWLKIGVEVDDGDGLVEFVEARLQPCPVGRPR